MSIAFALFASTGIGLVAYLALMARFAPERRVEPPVRAQPDKRVGSTSISGIAEGISRFVPQARVDKDSLRTRLAQAGLACTPSLFYGISVIVIVVGIAGTLTVAPLLSNHSLPLTIAVVVAGSTTTISAPRLFLDATTRKRRRAIEAQLPAALELLAVSVEAGLTMERAISYLSAQGKGVLSDEFGLVDRDISLFGYSREQALRRLAGRCQVEELSLFVSSVISSSKAGSPLAGALKSQARSARTRRFQKIEEDANKIPTKMIFPLTLLIMPGVFIVVLTPAALSIAHNIMGVM